MGRTVTSSSAAIAPAVTGWVAARRMRRISKRRSARRSGIASLLTKRCQQRQGTLRGNAEKEDARSIAQDGFAVFREPVDRRVFAPGFGLWLRLETPLQRLW